MCQIPFKSQGFGWNIDISKMIQCMYDINIQRCFILQMATDFFKWTDEENCTRTSKTPITFLDEKFEDLSQKPICKQVSFSLYIKNVRNFLRFIRNSWAYSHSHQRMFMIWKGFFFKNLVFFFFSSQWAVTGWLYNLCAKVGHFWELEEVLKQETAGSGAHTPFRSNSRDLKIRPHITTQSTITATGRPSWSHCSKAVPGCHLCTSREHRTTTILGVFKTVCMENSFGSQRSGAQVRLLSSTSS